MEINICFISRTSVLNKTLMSTLGKTFNSLSTKFPKDRLFPSLTLGIVGPSSHVGKLVERLVKQPKTVGEPKVLVSQLRKRWEKPKPQPNLELARQH